MYVEDKDETIAAISTPPGAGGIGIVRISGGKALAILQSIFVPGNKRCTYASHRLFYGHIVDSVRNGVVDEVLAVFMASPNTYTRDDVVEIQCHGNFIVQNAVLELVLKQGARLASPGEFTKRAFLNGRLDLTQAEAVIDILSARTRKGVDLGMEQLSGALYQRLEPIRAALVEMRALIEVAIDFPDEDVEIADRAQISGRVRNEVVEPLTRLLSCADQGRVFREGISIVIAGVPNVGKSSLLNTILQEERALVTSIPGTTRDSIEEVVDIYGMPAKIIDTAGIRENAEEIESLGIKRAHELINRADLVLFMLDRTRAISREDLALFRQVQHKPLLVVVNKADEDKAAAFDLAHLGRDCDAVCISAKAQLNIEDLKKRIFTQVVGDSGLWEELGCVPNLRHRRELSDAVLAAESALAALESGQTNDLVAIDLQQCLDRLANIVGETTTEDILDVIFAQFCLGK